MITQIRKVGNSAGVVIPSVMLKEVKLAIGTEIDLAVRNGALTIRPLEDQRRGKREISLAWLLADFQDVEEDLIPGAFGAEVLDNNDSDYRNNPQNS
ncbi:AbrB/MazE/SpoVT family DNA-binding domain-containing protein [Pseudomonas sp. YJ42]|jgi:antitoxin component of MazEF toxin-antitoxin module|uniref:AbrB/MazE/SpoVT family DNA-binding domain-containing protein n=1 Tax=Pseudomonas sp. YJ42 TaxID=3392115 RepID=UPI00399F24C0